MGRIEGLHVLIGETSCKLVFMVVNTNSYDIFLGLYFLIKIGIVLDIERGLIQVRQAHGANAQVPPLNMVNMLQLTPEQPIIVLEISSKFTKVQLGEEAKTEKLAIGS
jgi:hypothetical protein